MTNETFNAHDAKEDVTALTRVISHYGKPLLDIIIKKSKSLDYYLQLNHYEQLLSQCKMSYQGRISLKPQVSRLSELGIPYSSLKKGYEKCGRDAMIAFLATKVGKKPQVTTDCVKINDIILSLQ